MANPVLTRANLAHANLRDANLREANLSEANLLTGANLTDASLIRAQLDRANLINANLTRADLTGVRLGFAILNHTILSGANLTSANFYGAMIAGSVFADSTLSLVHRLESVIHLAPSTIGVDTLFKSNGKIPESFLRGCGVPEELIVQLPSIIGSMHPIQYYSCFISYSGKDDAFAKRLRARLQAEKLRVWFAPEDMQGGRKSAAQIDDAIRVYDRLLVLLSENSMNSEWVRREIKRARKKEKECGENVLFPIGLVSYKEIKAWECLDSDSGEDLAEKVREYHIPDFSQWKNEDKFEAAFADLMRDLKREAGTKRATDEKK